jgi:hypothetical protein
MNANWMQDDELSNISKEKLLLINSFLTDTGKMNQKEMMMFIMNLIKKCKQQNIQFSKEEMEQIMAVVKKHATPDELVKIDKIMKMQNMMK